jgi:ABC-type protease/lipase transport system fused ATPase/permease subunit
VVVLVAHRMSVLAGVDMILQMNSGQVQVFGPKDEVLCKLRGAVAADRQKATKTALASAPQPSEEITKKSA